MRLENGAIQVKTKYAMISLDAQSHTQQLYSQNRVKDSKVSGYRHIKCENPSLPYKTALCISATDRKKIAVKCFIRGPNSSASVKFEHTTLGSIDRDQIHSVMLQTDDEQ